MKLSRLRTDENAVSPVIGVILMVAVTVILAAVIASFVLGLGSTVSTAPQASFAYDFSDGGDDDFTDSDDAVTVTHDGGDVVPASAISVKVGGNVASSGSWPTKVSAGDSYTVQESSESFAVDPGDPVRVVWESSDSDQTSTLSASTVPDPV